jgi:formylglycine-generating enzyme required for sulfatase activity
MAYKPNFMYSLRPEQYAASPVPSLDEWKQLWAAWDTVTLQMIPREELLSKPIKLRNACIFYLGHVPTFLDIHLTRATKEALSGPSYYVQIFERGMDPDVDNPEVCHAHSEIPDEWPPVKEITDFQQRVRARVKSLYDSGVVEREHAIRKAMWIGFEHEVMHLETLLYMLIQSEKMLPPAGKVKPDFEAMAREARVTAIDNQWCEIPKQTVILGLEDDDSDHITKRFFGWDNEKPRRTVEVAAFEAKARPITNREYVQYMMQKDIQRIPASWSDSVTYGNHINEISNGYQNGHINGDGNASFIEGKTVRTVFGPVPLKLALDWPIMASYDELVGCAKWMGGRIPTMVEVRSIYEYVEKFKANVFENALQKTIPAVNR